MDGDGPINFHTKCDGISNTLILIKSAGNRRFGGFASQTWESSSNEYNKDDINSFLFSLDKQKIYCYKKDGKALRCHKDNGPCFGLGYTICVEQIVYKKRNYILWNLKQKAVIIFTGIKMHYQKVEIQPIYMH